MSVDTNMNIGFGFIVPRERYQEMMIIAEEKDLLCEVEDLFYCLNCYTERTDYFLGEFFFSSEEPVAISIAEIVPEDFNPDAFVEKYSEVLEICDVSITEEWVQPKFFAFLSIT